MIATQYSTIRFTMNGSTGHLMLNQPPSNRMSVQFFEELRQMTEELRNTEMKALVISGAGRHFSSGADPDELMNLFGEEKNDALFFRKNIEAFEFFENAEIPVISVIRGVCIGSALELALFSHFRFCGEDAVFGLPESSFSLMPGIGGISHLIELTGKAKAMELVLRGNTFPASAALEFGIVDRVLPKKELIAFAFRFAGKISGNYHKEKKILYLKRADEN
jgi:enoyl-CoA hydratase